MTEADQLKTFAAVTEVTRKWVAVLDTKAGFLVALNSALLTYIWASAKLAGASESYSRSLALISSALAVISLGCAAFAVFPRIKLDTKPSVSPFSFFAYVATKYPEQDGARFADDVLAMSDAELVREALEQHHAISHVALMKNTLVTQAAACWALAVVACVFSVAFNIRG
jgi:hypothetical protein